MAKRLLILAAAAAILAGGPAAAQAPKGWGLAGSRPGDYQTGLEDRGPGKVAFIRSKAPTAEGFGTLMQAVGATPYRGKRLRLSALLKTDDARRAQMWMRVDGATRSQVLAFDNMNSRPIVGTTGWKRYEVVLDVPADAVAVAYGFFLAGSGKVSADEFRLETVGTDVPVTDTFRPRNLSFEESRREAETAAG